MAFCPSCHTAGAYVGFTVIECRNPGCTHFKVMVEEAEAHTCCGGQPDNSAEQPGDPIDTADPALQMPPGGPPDATFGASDPP
jgi:hypothetical protein